MPRINIETREGTLYSVNMETIPRKGENIYLPVTLLGEDAMKALGNVVVDGAWVVFNVCQVKHHIRDANHDITLVVSPYMQSGEHYC